MEGFEQGARRFRARKQAEIDHARQMAAMSLACGLDMAAVLREPAESRIRILRRLERVIERERLKGMRRHWSYDLNRHIALKQVLDRLRDLTGVPASRQAVKPE